MDMFEKAAKAAKEVSGGVLNSAKNIGESLYSTTKEQSELASLNVQKSVIEKRLKDAYAEVGKRYVEYVEVCDGSASFDVADVLDRIKPDLEKLGELKQQMSEKETVIKAAREEKALKKAQEDFENEKQKLDKALSMEIISQEEYESKLAKAQKRLDHYGEIRKVDLQLEIGIISSAEHGEKIREILR